MSVAATVWPDLHGWAWDKESEMRTRKTIVGLVTAAFLAAPFAAPAAQASTCEVGAPGGEAVCAGFFAVMNLSCKVAGKVTKNTNCWA